MRLEAPVLSPGKRSTRLSTERSRFRRPEPSGPQQVITSQHNELSQRVYSLKFIEGDVWVDKTLDDWPDNDLRIFCGNLGNEVTDEVLANAFRKYPSFAKARVS